MGNSVQEVYLVGSSKLQNEAIAYFISKELGLRCSLTPTLDSIPPRGEGRRRLVLHEFNGGEDELEHLEASDTAGILQTDDVILILPRFCGHEANLEAEALRYGVCGFLYRVGSIIHLREMVEAVSKGELWVPTELFSAIVKRSLSRKVPAEKTHLSAREIEILRSLAMGKTNVMIATSCSLSPHTVKTHIHRIFKKLHLSNRTEAAKWVADYL
jgi:DNA-binding CsgD family transcriptional regulator